MLSNRTIVSGRISDQGDRKFEGPCRKQWRNNFVTNYRRRFREWVCQNSCNSGKEPTATNAFQLIYDALRAFVRFRIILLFL